MANLIICGNQIFKETLIFSLRVFFSVIKVSQSKLQFVCTESKISEKKIVHKSKHNLWCIKDIYA